MDPILLFTTAFVVGLSGAMAPGPVTIVLTRQALKRGFSSAPLITLGHGLLELLMLFFLFFGLGNFLSGRMAAVVGFLGGGMLIWMGQQLIRHPQGDAQKQNTEKGEETSPVLAGMLATVSNPYWFLWWGTIGASYVSLSRAQGWGGVFSFFFGHILSDFFWLSFLALALVTGRRWMTEKFYRGLMRFLGLCLVLFALFFLSFGMRHW